MAQADRALYAAKAAGRNCTRLANGDAGPRTAQRLPAVRPGSGFELDCLPFPTKKPASWPCKRHPTKSS